MLMLMLMLLIRIVVKKSLTIGFNSVAAFDSIFALSSALFLLSVSLIQIRTVLYNTDTDILKVYV